MFLVYLLLAFKLQRWRVLENFPSVFILSNLASESFAPKVPGDCQAPPCFKQRECLVFLLWIGLPALLERWKRACLSPWLSAVFFFFSLTFPIKVPGYSRICAPLRSLGSSLASTNLWRLCKVVPFQLACAISATGHVQIGFVTLDLSKPERLSVTWPGPGHRRPRLVSRKLRTEPR